MAGLYGYKWQQASKGYLRKHPYCAFHLQLLGKTELATVVDHKTPHHGDVNKFWDRSNWQGLCKHCHDSHKQRQEKSGVVVGCNDDGIPIDPDHHWSSHSSS